MTEIRAVILCDGRKPPKKQITASVAQAVYFIAADGGANSARELNLEPDFIIGDLDSYKPVQDETSTVIRDSDQETNDLEKALSLALRKGVTHTRIFGAFGRRPDHTLKNISVLKQYNHHFTELKFIDNFGELFLLPKSYTALLPVGTMVSLIPLTGCVDGITTYGLKYPLHGESLEMGVRDGTSNETVDEKIVITYEKGDLLLFIASKTENR